MQGGTHRKPCIQYAVCGHRRSDVIEGATGKAVHTEGGAHNRRYVVTAGVMLLEGPQARRYTQKAVHAKGGLWPPHE